MQYFLISQHVCTADIKEIYFRFVKLQGQCKISSSISFQEAMQAVSIATFRLHFSALTFYQSTY